MAADGTIAPREPPGSQRGAAGPAASATPGAAAAAAAAAAVAADRPAFLAFVADETSEAGLRGGLAEVGGSLQVRRGTARTAARALEREPTPRTLLVDVSGLDDPFAALDELAAVCTPDVRVLVVGENAEITFYRRLVREVGVADYIHKPLTRDAAARLVAPLLRGPDAGAEAPSRGGRIAAVCGVRGGVGATTVAVSLALEIAEATRGHVALLDLHLRGGATGMMLGVRTSSGFRVALEEPDRVDGLFLDRVAVPIDDRLRLIAAEEPMEAAPQPTEEGIRRVLAMLRQRFNHIVVDVPMPPGVAERAVIAAARHCVLVLGPDVTSVRDAVAARRMAAAMGATSRVLTVLNRAGQPGGLAAKLVEEGLGAAPDVTIADLPRQVPRATNLGRPAVREAAGLRRAIAPLTQEITALRNAEGERRSALARLLGRRRGR